MSIPNFYLQRTKSGWWVCYDSDLPEAKSIGPYSNEREARDAARSMRRSMAADPDIYDNGRGKVNCNREHPWPLCECDLCVIGRE